MKALAQSIEMVPESYQDDSFDIVVRDTRSVAVFWDLAEESRPVHDGARLSLRVQNEVESDSETLILHHEAGHVIVPLSENSRSYQIQLGWSDVNGFKAIAEDGVELPPLLETPATKIDTYRGSVFLPNSTAVERRGFLPATEL